MINNLVLALHRTRAAFLAKGMQKTAESLLEINKKVGNFGISLNTRGVEGMKKNGTPEQARSRFNNAYTRLSDSVEAHLRGEKNPLVENKPVKPFIEASVGLVGAVTAWSRQKTGESLLRINKKVADFGLRLNQRAVEDMEKTGTVKENVSKLKTASKELYQELSDEKNLLEALSNTVEKALNTAIEIRLNPSKKTREAVERVFEFFRKNAEKAGIVLSSRMEILLQRSNTTYQTSKKFVAEQVGTERVKYIPVALLGVGILAALTKKIREERKKIKPEPLPETKQTGPEDSRKNAQEPIVPAAKAETIPETTTSEPKQEPTPQETGSTEPVKRSDPSNPEESKTSRTVFFSTTTLQQTIAVTGVGLIALAFIFGRKS